MRKHYNNILKKFFWLKLIKSRAKLHLTQAQMSRKLIMEERSYIELDHGTRPWQRLLQCAYIGSFSDLLLRGSNAISCRVKSRI